MTEDERQFWMDRIQKDAAGHVADLQPPSAPKPEPKAADDQAPKKAWARPATVAAATAVVVALSGTAVSLSLFDNSPVPSGSGSNANTATGPVALAATNDACNGFTVQLEDNPEKNLVKHGLAGKNGGAPATEEDRVELNVAAKQDPRVFMMYWNASPMGKADRITDAATIAPLQNGACYTPDAITKYNQWSAMWMNPALTKLQPVALMAYGVNSGAEPGGNAFEQTGAIPAGTGVQVTHYDSTGVELTGYSIRLECGNVVLPAPPPPVTYTQEAPPPPPPVIITEEAPPPPPPVIVVPPPYIPPPRFIPPPPPPPCRTCGCMGNCPPPPPPPCRTCGCMGNCPPPRYPKDPRDTPRGPNVPGQNGHPNTDQGPGPFQPTRPDAPTSPVLPPIHQGPPPPVVAPEITRAPRPAPIPAPAPNVGTRSPGGGGGNTACPPMGCSFGQF